MIHLGWDSDPPDSASPQIPWLLPRPVRYPGVHRALPMSTSLPNSPGNGWSPTKTCGACADGRRGFLALRIDGDSEHAREGVEVCRGMVRLGRRPNKVPTLPNEARS